MYSRHLIVVSVDALVYEEQEFAKILGVRLKDAQGKPVDEISK